MKFWFRRSQLICKVCEDLKARHGRGRNFSIIVVSKALLVIGYNKDVIPVGERRRFGYVGEVVAKVIEENTGFETRVSVLGHIQRGGTPTAYDRLIGTQFGVKAVELVSQGKFGQMVSLRDNKLQSVDISEAVKTRKMIDMELYELAKVFFAS